MNVRRSFTQFLAMILLVLMAACQHAEPVAVSESSEPLGEDTLFSLDRHNARDLGKIVVANRVSGTLSVIDANTDAVVKTITMPNGGEPMYVVWSPATHRIFVGDRANDRVVVFSSRDYAYVASVPTGKGVFHMWADLAGKKQLWVNNDIDKTTTVIDPVHLSVLATIPSPPDLVARGGKPHDVLVDPIARTAYVSMLGMSGDTDYVIQYDTDSYTEIGRAAVGNDPHLSFSNDNRKLYVPCQGADKVFVIDPYGMDIIKQINVPNAHGAGMALRGETFHTTNISDGGTAGLQTIDTRRNRVRAVTDTPFPVPHNIALTPDIGAFKARQKLYITHSGGTADKVSVYDVRGRYPRYIKSITVGLNPFGLGYAR